MIDSQAGRFRGHEPLAVALAAVTAASAVLFYLIATHGTWQPTHELPGSYSGFFTAQAHAIVHGRLNVSYQLLNGECYFHNGNCFGYYGITPSLLRLPLLVVLDWTHSSLTAVYLTVALTLTVGASLATLYRLSGPTVSRRARPLIVVAAVALGPASVLLQLTRTAVFEEAIAWSIAFTCVALYALVRWWGHRSPLWLLIALIAGVLSANARPTGAVTALVLGAGVMLQSVRSRSRGSSLPRATWLLGVGLMLLPVASAMAVFELKLGTPFPNLLMDPGIMQASWWRQILAINGNQTVGLKFAPTAIVSYLRPDAVVIGGPFPFVNFRYSGFLPYAQPLWLGIPAGGAYVEPVSSLTTDMPTPCLILLAYAGLRFAKLPKSSSPWRSLFSISSARVGAVAALAGCVVTVTNVAITNRYLADFYPFVAFGVAVALSEAAPRLDSLRPGLWRPLLAVLTIGVIFGAAVNLALQYRLIWS